MNKDIATYLGSRLILLLILFVILNQIYVVFFLESDLQKHCKAIGKIRAVDSDTDILYLGESSNTAFRQDDVDTRPISAMIHDFYPELKVKNVTYEASHAGIYLSLLENISLENENPVVIVTMNMRSFNARWIHSKLENALRKSTLLLENRPAIVNRLLMGLSAYQSGTEAEILEEIQEHWKNDVIRSELELNYESIYEWNRAIAINGVLDSLGKWDEAKTQLSAHYVKTYAFSIDTLTNPRIKDFDAIISLSKKRGWKLVFNLMAENTEKAAALHGNQLLSLMESNRDLLHSYFSRKGVLVVDNLELVSDEQFIDQDWTTEHYAQKGRMKIAQHVSSSMSPFLAAYYREEGRLAELALAGEKSHSWNAQDHFEKGHEYNNMTEVSTGAGVEFGCTFQRKDVDLVALGATTVQVKIMASSKTLNDQASMVLELVGTARGYIFDSKPMKISGSDSWANYEIEFNLPPDIATAEALKVYVDNPSDIQVKVKDISLIFN